VFTFRILSPAGPRPPEGAGVRRNLWAPVWGTPLPAEGNSGHGLWVRHRPAPGLRDFEGGKSEAVKVLGNLGFTVQEIQRR